MYQVGIVECMQDSEDALMKALARYSEERDLRFHVRVFRSAEESLAAMSDECDILFVSCELSDADGLALAAEIRSRRPDVILILLSAQAENAFAGYAVEAFGFLLKPVGQAAFDGVMNRAISRKTDGGGAHKCLCLKTKNGQYCLRVRDIKYIEVRGHYLFYHARTYGGEGEFIVQTRGIMRDVEAELADCHFVRCSISYLVHLDFVDSVGADGIRMGGVRLPVSRNFRKQVRDAFSEYLGGSGALFLPGKPLKDNAAAPRKRGRPRKLPHD